MILGEEQNQVVKEKTKRKKMFNQDEGKIECAVETGRYDFGRAKRPRLF